MSEARPPIEGPTVQIRRHDADAPAYCLYRGRDWHVLGSQAPGDVVMGKRLRP